MDEELPELEKVILRGIVGSVAYGLATPESDIDFRGIHIEPTEKILGLYSVCEVRESKEPDFCSYEVKKFMSLALQCNPNILELLWLEPGTYVELGIEGSMLIQNRNNFLSQRAIKSYGGYAMAQMRRLRNRAGESFSSSTKNRYAKHARHLFRLLIQGQQVLSEGTLTVHVADRDAIFAVGELALEELEALFKSEYEKLQKVAPVVPPKPNLPVVNELLLTIRDMN